MLWTGMGRTIIPIDECRIATMQKAVSPSKIIKLASILVAVRDCSCSPFDCFGHCFSLMRYWTGKGENLPAIFIRDVL
jgi:hypothetical protein